MSETQNKVNYKKLNLPKTNFPMKANLAQNEPQTLKKWQKDNIYHKVVEKIKRKNDLFFMMDSYANGSIHVGHLLNKVQRLCCS